MLRWPAALRARSREELEEAKLASDAQGLSERAEGAVAMFIMTLQQLAQGCRDVEELAHRLAVQEPPGSPHQEHSVVSPLPRAPETHR